MEQQTDQIWKILSSGTSITQSQKRGGTVNKPDHEGKRRSTDISLPALGASHQYNAGGSAHAAESANSDKLTHSDKLTYSDKTRMLAPRSGAYLSRPQQTQVVTHHQPFTQMRCMPELNPLSNT